MKGVFDMNELEAMFQELLNQSTIYDPDLRDILGVNGLQDNDDDVEDFITSKEIAKTKQKTEERFGPTKRNIEIEEDVHFKRYTKRRKHKYTEKEMDEIRNSCLETIVHDYGEYDIYHMSDEDRAQNDMLSEISAKLARLKSSYNRVNEYIEAMRVVVQAWQILEKHNYVHTEEEFYQMVSEGRIVSSRIIMPKLKKMDSYNIDTLIKYVSNPKLDPMDLVPEKETKKIDLDILMDEFYMDDQDSDDELSQMFRYYQQEYLYQLSDDPEFKPSSDQVEEARKYAVEHIEQDEMERLLSPEEVESILNQEDDSSTIEVEDINPKYIKDYDKKIDFSKKDMSNAKKLFIKNLHNMLRTIQANPDNRKATEYNRSYLITHNMFEAAEPEKDFWDDLYYDGSWTDKESLELYDLVVREEILKQHPPKDHYITYADMELTKFFKTLEENGINTIDLRRKMNMTDDDITEKEKKRSKKENKKIEANLLQRVVKMNDNPKFKKIISKAEEAINAYNEGGKK